MAATPTPGCPPRAHPPPTWPGRQETNARPVGEAGYVCGGRGSTAFNRGACNSPVVRDHLDLDDLRQPGDRLSRQQPRLPIFSFLGRLARPQATQPASRVAASRTLCIGARPRAPRPVPCILARPTLFIDSFSGGDWESRTYIDWSSASSTLLALQHWGAQHQRRL